MKEHLNLKTENHSSILTKYSHQSDSTAMRANFKTKMVLPDINPDIK